MTFLVIAHDGDDPGAKERRQRVRQQHLEEVQPAVDAGVVTLGGAILDEAGDMVGSGLVIEAESREALEEILKNDIYSSAGVWQRFEIYPFKVAVQAKPG